MKKLVTLTLMFLLAVVPCFAQNNLNSKADNIVGCYTSKQNNDVFKVRISKNANGTYKAQIYWVENDKDAKGKKILDDKNPDKALRNVPCDKIVLFDGMKYNEKDHVWDGSKIYDPQRGLRAKCTCSFKDNKLYVKGTVLGISETVIWTRINE